MGKGQAATAGSDEHAQVPGQLPISRAITRLPCTSASIHGATNVSNICAAVDCMCYLAWLQQVMGPTASAGVRHEGLHARLYCTSRPCWHIAFAFNSSALENEINLYEFTRRFPASQPCSEASRLLQGARRRTLLHSTSSGPGYSSSGVHARVLPRCGVRCMPVQYRKAMLACISSILSALRRAIRLPGIRAHAAYNPFCGIMQEQQCSLSCWRIGQC